MVEVFPLDGLHPVSFARTMALRPSATGAQGDVLSGTHARTHARK